jgi:hypothetical protein
MLLHTTVASSGEASATRSCAKLTLNMTYNVSAIQLLNKKRVEPMSK